MPLPLERRSALSPSTRSARSLRVLPEAGTALGNRPPLVSVDFECASETSSEPKPVPDLGRGVPLRALRDPHEPVTLHIYDVSGDARVQWVNELFRPVGTGVFHAGVEIYGEEWSFGYRLELGTGVFSCHPMQNPAHRYREPFLMGNTDLTKGEVRELLQRFEGEWHGLDYDLLSRNCTHFCDALCRELGVGRIPGWLSNLADTGATLVDGVKTVCSHGHETALAVRAKARQVDECLQIWGTAEAAAKKFMELAGPSLGSPRSSPSVRSIKGTDAMYEEGPMPQCEILSRRSSEDIGSLAKKVVSAVSQLWDGSRDQNGAGNRFLDVVLECVSSSSLDIESVPRAQRTIGKRVGVRQPWSVGPRQQPAAFREFMPGFAKLPWEHLFEIAWEPPCLFLRKPSANAPLMVNGATVRQSTFVLLHNVEIAVFDPAMPFDSNAEPLVAFRLFRESIRDGSVVRATAPVLSSRAASRGRTKAGQFRRSISPPRPSAAKEQAAW